MENITTNQLYFVDLACSKDKTRPNLLAPFVKNGKLIGTDGHFMHYVLSDNPDQSFANIDSDHLPDCSLAIDSTLSLPLLAKIEIDKNTLKYLKYFNNCITIKPNCITIKPTGLDTFLSIETTNDPHLPSLTLNIKAEIPYPNFLQFGLNAKYLYTAINGMFVLHGKTSYELSIYKEPLKPLGSIRLTNNNDRRDLLANAIIMPIKLN